MRTRVIYNSALQKDKETYINIKQWHTLYLKIFVSTKQEEGLTKKKDDICISKLNCIIIKVKDSRPNVSTGIAEE